MFEPLNEHLITEFETCLAEPAPAGRKKEQVVQEFLEANTVLIPTPHRLNHGLHFKSIISKFPITSGLETDYVYLSKSSGSWQITFVELESPDKSIFTGATKTVQPSAEFQQAVSQIEDWRTYLSENKQEILNRLSPLIQPMSRNPINFK
ncbi:hypothetical protein ASF03_13755 [Rhizobium sp. Leaf68]|nr:hypothetical protein ASE62_13075 [Rhizobium sp. Leaf202]KQN84314.1 hypothetical protein ASF03_13755 [Rhizobium sp. Leaf68]